MRISSMDSRSEPTLNSVSPPKAMFSRQHYHAVAYVLASIDDTKVRQAITLKFNHYFRGTQEGYDPGKFFKACKVEA
jgi:hypothetical protein